MKKLITAPFVIGFTAAGAATGLAIGVARKTGAIDAVSGLLGREGDGTDHHAEEPARPEPGHEVSDTPDKPAGTELHPPNQNFARQGPGGGSKRGGPKAPKKPATGEPPAQAGPGEPGLTAPKRGAVGG